MVSSCCRRSQSLVMMRLEPAGFIIPNLFSTATKIKQYSGHQKRYPKCCITNQHNQHHSPPNSLKPCQQHSVTRRWILLATGTIALTSTLALTYPFHTRSETQKGSRRKLKFISEESGIRYADIEKGDGPFAEEGQLVIIDYIGYLSDGRVFDNTMSSGRKPVSFLIGKRQIIPGLEQCLLTMKQGGRRIVIVPPKLAYGQRGVCLENNECLIPPNETLEYDVTLRRIALAPI